MADMSFTAQMAAKLGLEEKYVIPYGYDKAKVSLEVLKQDRKRGRLIYIFKTLLVMLDHSDVNSGRLG